MRKSMMSAAGLAICLGASAAFAQSDSDKTTTTVTTPAGTTQTTTTSTQSNDGYAQYRRTETSTKHYRAGAFAAPAGFVYVRFTVGQHVPAALLGHVTLDHYSMYGLHTPPDGLGWARIGRDALLVDRNTGEVVQADYGLFED